MSSPRQEHQSFPRQEHQEIEKTFNDLHISGNTGKTVLTHNPKPQYQQQPTHNEPRQRSSPEPKNRTPFGHVVRHNYPSHYQDNHATDVQRTDYDPITRYQTDTKQNDQQMKHTTAYYADNENTTSKTTTPKLHPRTTQLTFQRYRDAPNTSVMSHSTTTSRTNENNQTQRASLLGNEGTDLGGDSPFFEYIYPNLEQKSIFAKKSTLLYVRINILVIQRVKTSKNPQKTTVLSDSVHYIASNSLSFAPGGLCSVLV